ncbi:ABC transporter substrate-binding protein, partial [Streptomyces sp. SID6013]|nr:ABC transporter substrate-binding protein [Streptomyces sp. SID6013]
MDAVRRAAHPSRRGVLRAGGGAALAALAGTAVTGCGAGTDDGVAADG